MLVLWPGTRRHIKGKPYGFLFYLSQWGYFQSPWKLDRLAEHTAEPLRYCSNRYGVFRSHSCLVATVRMTRHGCTPCNILHVTYVHTLLRSAVHYTPYT